MVISVATIMAFNLSYKPAAYLVNKLFEGGVAVTPTNYLGILENVNVEKDLEYPSSYKDNQLDIISPKNKDENTPVIFWVHGGAFVGGDKSDVLEYAVQIANQGYSIVSINYELATTSQYPSPIIQLQEAYDYINTNQKELNLNLDKIFFVGDSAGTHIVNQFSNIQVNPSYAQELDIKAGVDSKTIYGNLLFCGPYDIAAFENMSDSNVLNFFFDKIGWAYIGEKDWKHSKKLDQASIINYVDQNFPPSFITDGNKGSFEAQGKALEAKLLALDV